MTAYRRRTTYIYTTTYIGVTTNMVMELKCTSDQLELYKDNIINKRKGFGGKLHFGFYKGDKIIYLNPISGIKLKEPGIMVRYIKFIHPGNIERTKDSFFGENGVTNDEIQFHFIIKTLILSKE